MEPFPPLAAQLLHNRGIGDVEAAEAFLARDERLLEDPALLPGMARAVARLRTALDAGETIGVFGDFDADGVTGTALLSEGLEHLGARVIPYLPRRDTEGHGLSSQAVQSLHGDGASLIVTVDCGVASFAEVAEATALGMETIITDHHSPPPLLPEALAIVNPRLDGSTYPSPGLAGVGLAFKLTQGLYNSLGLPWNEQFLQLAAIGTVTDVVPLVGENRYIVAEGLRSMNVDPRPGLRELLRTKGGESAPVDTESISYVLGPRLNAPGRLGHAISAYNLLRAPSQEEAIPFAEELERLNRERQELMGRATVNLKAQAESLPDDEPLLMVWSEEYASGIVGLLAGQLSEERYRPAIVAAVEGDLARASARSIPEFNLASALEECSDLFVRYGGHPRAAGFEARVEVLPELRSRLNEIARREIGHLQLQPGIRIDAHVRLSTLNAETLSFLEELAPFGEGNPAPVFVTKGASVLDASRIGANGQHLRLRLRQEGVEWGAIAFGMGEAWQDGTERIDVVYSLGLDRWNGREAMRLVVHDFRPSDSDIEDCPAFRVECGTRAFRPDLYLRDFCPLALSEVYVRPDLLAASHQPTSVHQQRHGHNHHQNRDQVGFLQARKPDLVLSQERDEEPAEGVEADVQSEQHTVRLDLAPHVPEQRQYRRVPQHLVYDHRVRAQVAVDLVGKAVRMGVDEPVPGVGRLAHVLAVDDVSDSSN